MTTIVKVEIKDLDVLAKGFANLSNQWGSVGDRALKGAMINGQFMKRFGEMVPMSDPGKYASRRVDLTKSDWQSSNKAIKGGDQGKGYIRYRHYGQRNLYKSFFNGQNARNPRLEKIKQGGIGYIINSSVAYAAYVHEAERPAPGHYWDGVTPGGPGWSRQGSGAHFIDIPLEESGDDILVQFQKNIDAYLRSQGLM